MFLDVKCAPPVPSIWVVEVGGIKTERGGGGGLRGVGRPHRSMHTKETPSACCRPDPLGGATRGTLTGDARLYFLLYLPPLLPPPLLGLPGPGGLDNSYGG